MRKRLLGFEAEWRRDERYIADRCSQTGCRRRIIAGRLHEKKVFGPSHLHMVGPGGGKSLAVHVCGETRARENV